MRHPNFRELHCATWRPEAPERSAIRFAGMRAIAVTAFRGRRTGRTVLVSLLLASCAYRPDAGNAPSTASSDGFAHTDGASDDASASPVASASQAGAAAPSAFSGGFAHAPRRRTAPAETAGHAANILPFFDASEDIGFGEVPSDAHPHALEIAPTTEPDPSTASSATTVPAPAAVLLDIEHDSTGDWLWLSPWYALPVLLAIGIPLIGLRDRRRKISKRRTSHPPLILDTPEPAAPALASPVALIESPVADAENVAAALGHARAAVSWEVGRDPLAREDWSIHMPVDYSPRMPLAVATAAVDSETAAGSQADVTVTEAAPEALAARPVDAAPPSEPIVAEEPASAIVAAPAALFDRIEAMGRDADGTPHFFLQEDGYLPIIVHAEHAPLSAERLHALEHELLETVDPAGEPSTWLLTQVLALRMAQAERGEVDALHQAAFALAMHGWERASASAAPHWLARLIDIDLAQANRLSGAARLLALRNMGMRYADDIERGDAPVLKAWIGVLLYWAQHQLGDSALARYAEAAATAQRLRGIEGMADEGQLLLAETMRRRAGIEQGGVRAQTLDDAQELLDELFTREPSGRVALAIAETALARGRHATPAMAKEAFSHALTHAFLAGSDPRWQADSLQCRLAIQLAYESLPGMPVQGRVALDLAQRLEHLPMPSRDTLERMAHAFLRHEEYARACHLCAEAWRGGAATDGLLAVWRQAGGQWAAHLATPGERAAWQENERQRRMAGQMH